jgi:PTS system nitrogen regulatory IIA component
MHLDIDQLARCLDIPLDTMERWIRQGRIPVRKKGGACEFSEAVVAKWAEANHLRFTLPGTVCEANAASQDQTRDDLVSVMRRGGVYFDIEASSVEEVLWKAVERLPFFSDPEKKEVLYGSLVAREQMMSTGIGKGVALPHPRTPLSRGGAPAFIATFFLRAPLDYRAIDKRPVSVLFLLVSPSAKLHLHLLAQLSYCLRDEGFLDLLNRHPDPETLFSRISELAEGIDAAG